MTTSVEAQSGPKTVTKPKRYTPFGFGFCPLVQDFDFISCQDTLSDPGDSVIPHLITLGCRWH